MPESPAELDLAVRLAAFAFLENRLLEGAEETVSFDVLRTGFVFRGRRVPMMGRLILPGRKNDHPNRDFLAQRYETFRRAG